MKKPSKVSSKKQSKEKIKKGDLKNVSGGKKTVLDILRNYKDPSRFIPKVNPKDSD